MTQRADGNPSGCVDENNLELLHILLFYEMHDGDDVVAERVI